MPPDRAAGMEDRVKLCAGNNLDWYEAVLRTHGLSGAIADGLWSCRGSVPPYYSNAITVSPNGTARQIAVIVALAEEVGAGFSVKDAFGALDLAPHGLRLLFSADWVWRDPAPVPAEPRHWSRVTTAEALRDWHDAWRNCGSPTDRTVFLPGLLDDPSVALFGCFRDGRITAGCVANRSDEVVGLSNVFTEADDDEVDFAAAVDVTAGFAPNRPIVGYERGTSLATAIRYGFTAVGPLRIWQAGKG